MVMEVSFNPTSTPPSRPDRISILIKCALEQGVDIDRIMDRDGFIFAYPDGVEVMVDGMLIYVALKDKPSIWDVYLLLQRIHDKGLMSQPDLDIQVSEGIKIAETKVKRKFKVNFVSKAP